MKKSIFMLAAAAVVASCTKTEIYENGQAAGPDIIAKSAHQLVSGELSRAPFIGNIAADNHLEARVLTFKMNGDVLCDGHINFTTPTTIASYVPGTIGTYDGKYPALLDDEYYMTGFYPADSWGAVANKTSTVTRAFDGSDDIMLTGMETIVEQDINMKTAPTLTFEHQLTKFEVKVKAKDATGKAAWSHLKSVNISKIQGDVSNLKNEATCDLSTGAVTFDLSGTAEPFKFYGVDADGKYSDDVYVASAKNIYETTDAEYVDLPVAYTMIAPFVPTNTANDVTLEVEANDGTNDKSFTINLSIPKVDGVADTAGYAYTIVLTFADDMTIIAEAQVKPWANGGVIDHTIN